MRKEGKRERGRQQEVLAKRETKIKKETVRGSSEIRSRVGSREG